MNNSKKLLRIAVLSMLIALGVVISPIMRIEGMCPMAHFINIVCSVLLGPWYSLLCGIIIGVIRMVLMSIPPLALTGQIFGAFLSGVFYRLSKGKILSACIGETIGTGVIGAIISYPVMTFLWGKDGLSWMFYVPSFIFATLIGGSIAFVFLKKLSRMGALSRFQTMLSSKSYGNQESVIENSASIGAFGVILFIVIKVLASVFKITSPVVSYSAYILMILFVAGAVVYYFLKRKGGSVIESRKNK